ncbi:MAG: glycosyltransferase family 4 protein [Candidatus Paceibacterota bacterium]
MKILILNNRGTLHAGAEMMICHLRRGLEEGGDEVRVLSGDERGSGDNFADVTFKTFTGNSPLRFFYVFNPFALLALRRELRNYRPDVVHLHTISKASPFILFLLKDFPTVLTIHDHTLFDPTRVCDIPLLQKYKTTFSDYFIDTPSLRFYLEKLRFFFFRCLAKNIDTTFACSYFYRECALSSNIFKNARTLHNSVELSSPRPMENWNRILFVGRLDREKGVRFLLEAYVRLRDKYPDLKLCIVGEGQERGQLQKRIKDLGMENSIKIVGYKSQEEISELYRKTTLLVVPSLHPDNLPTVCIEAMAIGRPIVASDVGGIPELVSNGETGILVPPADAQSLAIAIDTLLSNRKLIQEMGQAGRKKAEKEFNIDFYMQETIQEYYKLIRKYENRHN